MTALEALREVVRVFEQETDGDCGLSPESSERLLRIAKRGLEDEIARRDRVADERWRRVSAS